MIKSFLDVSMTERGYAFLDSPKSQEPRNLDKYFTLVKVQTGGFAPGDEFRKVPSEGEERMLNKLLREGYVEFTSTREVFDTRRSVEGEDLYELAARIGRVGKKVKDEWTGEGTLEGLGSVLETYLDVAYEKLVSKEKIRKARKWLESRLKYQPVIKGLAESPSISRLDWELSKFPEETRSDEVIKLDTVMQYLHQGLLNPGTTFSSPTGTRSGRQLMDLTTRVLERLKSGDKEREVKNEIHSSKPTPNFERSIRSFGQSLRRRRI